MKRWTDLDKAIIGTTLTYQDGERVPVIVYSGVEIVTIYMERDGMEWDEAMDYIDFNLDNAYIGKDTPLIVWDITDHWEDQDV